MIEGGVKDFTAASYVGILAPAKTPPEVIAVLESALKKGLADKAVQDKFLAVGADLVPPELQKIEQKVDHLAKGVKLTPQEQKVRHAIAIIANNAEEHTRELQMQIRDALKKAQ